MKIIDSKGRFLGLINIFDIIAIALTLAISFAFFYWIAVGKNTRSVERVKVKSAVIQLTAENVTPEVISRIRKGDVAVLENGAENARVLDIVSVEPTTSFLIGRDGRKAQYVHRKNKDVVLLMKVVYYAGIRREKMIYTTTDTRPLLVGTSFDFDTGSYHVAGTITEVRNAGE